MTGSNEMNNVCVIASRRRPRLFVALALYMTIILRRTLVSLDISRVAQLLKTLHILAVVLQLRVHCGVGVRTNHAS